MNEAITWLIRTVEGNDIHIVTLISKMELQNDEEVNPEPKQNDNPPDKEFDEEELIHEDKVDTSVGSLSIKQLQDMIINTIKAQ